VATAPLGTARPNELRRRAVTVTALPHVAAVGAVTLIWVAGASTLHAVLNPDKKVPTGQPVTQLLKPATPHGFTHAALVTNVPLKQDVPQFTPDKNVPLTHEVPQLRLETKVPVRQGLVQFTVPARQLLKQLWTAGLQNVGAAPQRIVTFVEPAWPAATGIPPEAAAVTVAVPPKVATEGTNSVAAVPAAFVTVVAGKKAPGWLDEKVTDAPTTGTRPSRTTALKVPPVPHCIAGGPATLTTGIACATLAREVMARRTAPNTDRTRSRMRFVRRFIFQIPFNPRGRVAEL
jgi:hypothetical protein